MDGRAEAFGVPSSQELGPNIVHMLFLSHAFLRFVHGSIFRCPRRRGTTPTHPELGG